MREMTAEYFVTTHTRCSFKVVVKTTERSVGMRRLKENPKATTGTADILDALKALYPSTTFSWALGADTYFSLSSGKWKRSTDVAKHIQNRFQVVTRSGGSDEKGAAEAAAALEAKLAEEHAKARAQAAAKEDNTAFGGELLQLPIPAGQETADVSSTVLRNLLSTLGGSSTVEVDSPLRSAALVAPEVLGYARAHSLFSAQWQPEAETFDLAEVERYQAKAKLKNAKLDQGFSAFNYVMAGFAVVATLSGLGFWLTHAGYLTLPVFLGGRAPLPLLTVDTWDAAVANKAVMVKMFAPWCGHCKKLKPTWHALALELNEPAATSPGASSDGSSGWGGSLLIADVDCTTPSGKPLCSKFGVRGFPTLLSGSEESGFSKYEGDRSLKALKEHARKLPSPCRLDQLESCTSKQQELVQEFRALSAPKLQAKIEAAEAAQKAAEKDFDAGVEALRASRQALSER